MAKPRSARMPQVTVFAKDGKTIMHNTSKRDAEMNVSLGNFKKSCTRCERVGSQLEGKPFCGAHGKPHVVIYMVTDQYGGSQTTKATITFREMEANGLSQVFHETRRLARKARRKIQNWAEASSMNRSVTVTAYPPSNRSVFA